jgi:hypothetical protein
MKPKIAEDAARAPSRIGRFLLRYWLPGLLLFVLPHACTTSRLPARISGETCLAKEIQRLEQLPEKQVITTLDGQQIDLNDFSRAALLKQPGCFLPFKFYHWQHDVMEMDSRGRGRQIKHTVRAYYNLGSVCFPEKRDDGQICGDVAEFYSEHRRFMGFAVYMGRGLYCPLPYFGYTGPASIEAMVNDRHLGNRVDINLNERKEG